MILSRIRGILLVLLLAVSSPVLHALDGGQGFGILDLKVGGKALAMGGAFVSIADDATAVFWNPAGLGFIDGDELTLFYDGLDGFFYHLGYIGYGRTLSDVVSIGFGFKTLLSGMQQDNTLGTQFYENQYMIAAGIGFTFPFKLRLGATLKTAFRSFTLDDGGSEYRYKGNFFNIDIGVLYPVTSFWNVGLKVENVIPNMNFSLDGDGDEFVYSKIVLGTSVSLFHEKFRIALDFDYLPAISETEYHVGLEYRLIKQFSLYAGLNGGAFSFGLNLYLTDFSFYAVTRIQSGREPGGIFGLHYKIGKKKREYKSIEYQMKELTKGLNDFIKGDYKKARAAFKKVLKENPKNETARRMDMAAKNRLGSGDWRTQKDRDFIKKHFEEGVRLFDAKEYPESRKRFKLVLDVDPLHWKSRDYIEKIEKLIRDTVRMHFKAAVNAFIKNKLDDSKKELRQVLSLENDHKQANELLARIRRLQKEAFERMQQDRRRMENAEIYFRRGMAFFNRSIYIDAAESFRLSYTYLQSKKTKYYYDLCQKRLQNLKVSGKSIGKSEDLFNEAMKTIKTGKNYRQAIKALEKAINYNPNNKQAAVQLAIIRKQQEKEVKKPFDEGVALYKSGKFLAALKKWRQALAIDSDYQPALQYIKNTAKEMQRRSLENMQLADIHYKRGTDSDVIEAMRYYKNAYELWTKNNRAKIGWERCVNRLEKKARSIYQSAFEALKSNKKERLQEAIDNFEKYLLMRPDDRQAQKFLADATRRKTKLAWYFTVQNLLKAGLRLFHNRDYSRSLEKFKEVQKYDPKNKIAARFVKDCRSRLKLLAGRNAVMQIFNDGIRDFKGRDYDKAIATWRKILVLPSATAGDKRMVEGYIKTAQEVREYNQNKFFIQGQNFARSGRLIDARNALQEALKINKQHSGARRLLSDVQDRIRALALKKYRQGRADYLAGKYANSLTALNEAKQLREDDQRIADQLEETQTALKLKKEADALYAKRKFVDAIRTYASLRRLNAADPVTRRRISGLSEQLAGQSAVFIKKAKDLMDKKDYNDALVTVNLVLDFVKYLKNEDDRKVTTKFAGNLKLRIQAEINTLVRVNYATGLRYYSRNDYTRALPYFNIVYAYNRTYENIRSYRRIAAVRVAAARQAADRQKQAQIQRLLYTGISLYRQGKYGAAINVWSQILAISPGHSAARGYIARARFKLGR